MQTNQALSELLRTTSELVQMSERLKNRAQRTISASAAVIDQSRELLSQWPANGSPALSPPQLPQAVPAAEDKAHAPPRKADAAVAEPSLERVCGQNFTGVIVSLDSRHFVGCTMERCLLEYCGGPVVLEETHFEGCRFRFGAEAAMTVSLLECFGLAGAPLSECVEPSFFPVRTTSIN